MPRPPGPLVLSPDIPPPDLVEMGRVVAAFGVQGWLKIKPHSSQPDVLLGTDTWWLQPPSALSGADPQPFAVRSSRMHAAFVLAHLHGVDDRDAAHALKGHSIWISRAAFPAPSLEEWYWVDLMGCQLYGQDSGQPVVLGKVAEVSDNGAHAMLHVQTAGAKQKTVLVPFVAKHVLAVDVAAKRIDTNWPVDF